VGHIACILLRGIFAAGRVCAPAAGLVRIMARSLFICRRVFGQFHNKVSLSTVSLPVRLRGANAGEQYLKFRNNPKFRCVFLAGTLRTKTCYISDSKDAVVPIADFQDIQAAE
jgi:hypothetical protein